ncbi:MAG: phosphoribosylglycinamide formyltransferase [Atribacterota bacterium]|nr:phosphoribosylglycinamide formyltransferase [Atribacterota bacterium]MDD4896345.1 phosphoribosylglycinamide formyltransferase [Atribacterota bacterium]MDD5637593.1 phosphoribosylglycinamide formyltransferase [Atribacterota bacterium]
MISIAVLVSGRGSNLQAIINAIKKGRINGEIKLVLCDNPRAYALQRAKKNNIKIQVVHYKMFSSKEEYEQEIIKHLDSNKIDLIVLAGYMRLLSPSFVKKYHYRIINIHPALLPAFPGLHAQRQALEYGVKVSGCTVHFVDEGVDSGPIILQKAVEVKQFDDEESLSRRILKYEHQLLPRAIQLFAQGKIEIIKDRIYLKD